MPTTLAETHISVVFFVGDRAYKLKKAVRTPFLDFSTREARREVCHREVELNRRLAPDVYLGVADVHDVDGEVCDHLVVMRRMPPEHRLAALARDGHNLEACLDRVAHTVAAFHSRAEASETVSHAGRPEAIRRMWDDNTAEMRAYVGGVLPADPFERMHHLAIRYLEGREPLLVRRVEDGRIRDGHGDLLADDVFCLPDGPRILDCIEFDDRLRHGDVIADVAFLAMDLEQLGRAEAARHFLRRYLELSGETTPQSLVDHYIAYRAQVRAKIACIRHEQGDTAAADDARRLLTMAVEHLERAQARLVLVGGLPGTGKSTLAEALSDETGWTVLRSDELRKEMAGLGHTDRREDHYGTGMYAPEMTEKVYAELLGRAERLLGLGESVILDASWLREAHREAARDIARRTASEPLELECVTESATADARIRGRAEEGSDPSDATPDIAARMREEAEAWHASIGVDTSGSLDVSLRAALDALRDATGALQER